MAQATLPRLKLLAAIVDRDKGEAAAGLFQQEGLYFDFLCMGRGTANSQILDYFGLSETEKDVVLTLVPAPRVNEVIRLADERFHFDRPGRGILFTVPLSAVSGQVPRVLCKEGGPEVKKEENNVDTAGRWALIVVVVNRGNVDAVMDAARSRGARGGTVLHARRVGMEDMEKVLGFPVQPEKEIVAILAPQEHKRPLMEAISEAAGITTEARGVLFALPVENLIGLQALAAE